MPGPAIGEKTAIKTAIAVPFLVLLLGRPISKCKKYLK